MPVSLGELAVRFGSELHGDPDAAVDRVATLQDAGPGTIAFLANPKYRKHLPGTRATVVVLDAASLEHCRTNALVASNPYATYARIAQHLNPEPGFSGGRHPSAVVEPGATVDASAWIGPHCYVGAGAVVGPAVYLGPGTVLLAGASLGAGTRCVARVTVCERVRIGQRCLLHPGVVIGADGFGQAPDQDGYVKVPQLGAVTIGDDVEIGANTTIDRGAIDDTIVEHGVKIDNQVQIGHNCRVGEHTVIAGCAGISGSVTIGKRCMVGGMVGIVGHLEVCDDVYLTGKTMVTSSITEPGLYSGQLPFDEARRFRRNSARFQKLDELAQRVLRLERAKRSAGGAEAAAGDESSEENDT
jgi:UDP-3-O-[3-hydroxymyristoyl] glucosamine N-acyltransferase